MSDDAVKWIKKRREILESYKQKGNEYTCAEIYEYKDGRKIKAIVESHDKVISDNVVHEIGKYA